VPTRKEINQRVIAKLNEKGRGAGCPICGHKKWSVQMEYVNLTLVKDPRSAKLGGEGMPLQPLTCANCGNTQLVNLLILGFKEEELSELVYPDEPAAK
jgi:hypothetical protein